MPAKHPILAALVAPHCLVDFLDRHWPDRVFAAHGSPQRLPPALQAPEFQSVEALAAKYRGRIDFGNALVSSRTVGIENANPALLLRMGLSLYLSDIAAMMPALVDLLRQLEQELGAPTGAARIGAFAASPGNGVTCHFDAEEVFSIQLQGQKRFHIAKATDMEQPWGMQFNPGDPCFDDLFPQVPAGFPDPACAQFETVDMTPGTVLFMPRGTWHYTECSEGSLSVSIIVRTPAAFECAVEALRLRLLQDARWRRPLHGAWGSPDQAEAARSQWRELLKDLPRVAAELGLEEGLLTQLPEAARLDRVRAASRFQRRPEARMELSPVPQGGQAVKIVVRRAEGGEHSPLTLESPPAMVAVFQWLKDHSAAFSLEDMARRFPGLPPDQHLRIVHALTRGLYLKQLWFGSILPADGS